MGEDRQKTNENNALRIVADADVLAADLLVGGPARECLNQVRRHSWIEILASEQLRDETAAVIESLTDATLAADWRACFADEYTPVSHPAGDHPALGSAYHGEATHLLSSDERLTSPKANVSLQAHAAISIRTPDSFATMFDPERVYESLFEEVYPGPDAE